MQLQKHVGYKAERRKTNQGSVQAFERNLSADYKKRLSIKVVR